MKIKNGYYVIFFAAAFFLSVMALFSFNVKTKQNMQTFDKIQGFIFDFPIFKEWEVKSIKKINDDECVIYFNYPKNVFFELAPQILIRRINNDTDEEYIGLIEVKKATANNGSQTINYSYLFNPLMHSKNFKPSESDWDDIEFYGKDFKVSISRFLSKENGFDDEIFYNKIIETFNFTGDITQTKTFSESGDFSFDYPVIKNLREKEIIKDSKAKWEWVIVFLEQEPSVDFESLFQVNILKTHTLSFNSAIGRSPGFYNNKNPNKVSYNFFKENGRLEFYGFDYGILIDFSGVNDNFFSIDLFVNKIVETFKFL